jgi:hypothetical protein
MKNFNDLKFTEHPSTFGGEYSKIFFDNGFGILVYGGRIGLYEVEILDSNGDTLYDTNIINGNFSGANIDDINHIMEQIQLLQ